MIIVYELTERQKEVLEFIKKFWVENGFAPSMRNIGDHFGFSIKGAADHLAALERKGFISRDRGIARSIRILK